MTNNNQNISESIIDNIDTIIYIYNNNKEVLYLNKKAKNTFGKISNRKCWQFLHKKEKKPCAICPLDYLFITENSLRKKVWDNYNPSIEKWFENHSQIINYKGKEAILEIAIDITDRKKDEKQILTFLNYQNTLYDIAETFNSSLSFNTKSSRVFNYIAKIFKPSRINIGIRQKNELKIITEWNRAGVKPLSEKNKKHSFSKKDFPYIQIVKKGILKINSIENQFSDKFLKLFDCVNY